MYALILIVHVVVAIFLIGVILLQGGRGGLGEALGGSGTQSLFGGGANVVMTKVTAGCASLFMVTCLSLAALSTGKGRSVIDQVPMTEQDLPLTLPQAADRFPAAHNSERTAAPHPAPSATAPHASPPSSPAAPATTP